MPNKALAKPSVLPNKIFMQKTATQAQSVVDAMKDMGGFSTLGELYQKVLGSSKTIWKTKTPTASIRRIVQTDRRFFRIRPGLWALREYESYLPNTIVQLMQKDEVASSPQTHTHSYIQGLLTEIGKMQSFDTFIPAQDKNKEFLGKKLIDVSSLNDVPSFTYPHICSIVRNVDVVWFNFRKMPTSFIEVEHSTELSNSLSKFVELQDFHAELWIVAPQYRKREFDSRVERSAFKDIRGRVKFKNYEYVERLHSNLSERLVLEAF